MAEVAAMAVATEADQLDVMRLFFRTAEGGAKEEGSGHGRE